MYLTPESIQLDPHGYMNVPVDRDEADHTNPESPTKYPVEAVVLDRGLVNITDENLGRIKLSIITIS